MCHSEGDHHIDLEEILGPIRKSELTRLATYSLSDEQKRSELYDFIKNEPININHDIFMKIASFKGSSIALVSTPSIHIKGGHVKPIWNDRSFHGAKIYLKRLARYFLLKLLSKLLPDLIDIHHQIKPCTVVAAPQGQEP